MSVKKIDDLASLGSKTHGFVTRTSWLDKIGAGHYLLWHAQDADEKIHKFFERKICCRIEVSRFRLRFNHNSDSLAIFQELEPESKPNDSPKESKKESFSKLQFLILRNRLTSIVEVLLLKSEALNWRNQKIRSNRGSFRYFLFFHLASDK